MVWELPPQHSKYLTDPSGFIGSLLGGEGSGSVLSALQGKGYANALSAGINEDFTDFSLFSIDIRLTPDGMVHADEVRHS